MPTTPRRADWLLFVVGNKTTRWWRPSSRNHEYRTSPRLHYRDNGVSTVTIPLRFIQVMRRCREMCPDSCVTSCFRRCRDAPKLIDILRSIAHASSNGDTIDQCTPSARSLSLDGVYNRSALARRRGDRCSTLVASAIIAGKWAK